MTSPPSFSEFISYLFNYEMDDVQQAGTDICNYQLSFDGVKVLGTVSAPHYFDWSRATFEIREHYGP